MSVQTYSANPFSMLLNAEAVLQEMHRSESLERLEHHVHRPLDKVTKVRMPADLAAFDASVDATLEIEEADDVGGDLDAGSLAH